MSQNPYLSPNPTGELKTAALTSISSTSGILSTTRRKLAVLMLALPIVLALPICYWAFNIAGDWFVKINIDLDERRSDIAFLYLLIMAAVIAASIFPSLLLLFLDRYRRLLTGLLLLPALVAFI